jgi:choline dehydrogenase-like flavoprotein
MNNGDASMETSRRFFLKAGTLAALVLAAGGGIYRAVHTSTHTPFVLDGEARAALEAMVQALPQRLHLTRVASAHVMGGCTMAGSAKRGVVDPEGRYRGLRNLSVHDGSLFPTGANPQLSIYGIAARLASGVAENLTGRPAPRAGA